MSREELQTCPNCGTRTRFAGTHCTKKQDVGNGCFASSTLVLTLEGWRRIDQLNPGDSITSFDVQTGQLINRRVINRKDHGLTRLWELNIAATTKPVSTTSNHPFLTPRGWLYARKLKKGDLIRTFEGIYVEVQSIEKTSRFEPVHNLITEGEHNYIADHCVVHNFVYFRMLRAWWYRMFGNLQPRRRVRELEHLHTATDGNC